MLHVTTAILLALFTIFVHAYPVADEDTQKNSDEVIFVPYDVKYVPIEVPASVSPQDLEKVLNHDSSKSYADEPTESTKKASSLELLKEKFDVDETKTPEDYVLVPVSLLKSLKSSDKHIISKRQAPGSGNSLRVYTPVVQFSSLSRNRRRVRRPPPLVGYLNNYDQFPTVA